MAANCTTTTLLLIKWYMPMGGVCQSVTDLAFELAVPFEMNEFRTLNRCLDDAIANAVMEFIESARYA